MFANMPIPLISLLAETAAAAPPVQFRLDTLVFSLLIFVILVIVLARYAWHPIIDGLERREKSIARNIDDARTANEQAKATLAQYEQKMKATAEEARRIVDEARKDGDRAREKIVAEANAEAQRQRERAIAEITAAKNAAIRELAERSVDSAITLAGNLVGKELRPDDHARLIEQSLQRFEASAN